jgi:hypothetical protein
MMLGTRVAETILASGYVRPHTKAGHMSASDPIKSLLNNLARRGPSTYGVSWVWSGLVEIAVGDQIDRMLQNRRRHPFPPSGVAPARELVSVSGSVPIGYAGLNSVPCRSIACMMIASRRARAIRAFRIVDRAAIASAQSFSFSGPL